MDKVCGNCKHYVYDLTFGFDCTANIKGQNVVSNPPVDFGCNRFESKKDKPIRTLLSKFTKD